MLETIMTKDDILKRLNNITSSCSFIYVVAEITRRDFCVTIEDLSTRNSREHLNYNEVAFLIGLWLKNIDLNNKLNIRDQESIIDETYELMEKLHFTFLTEGPKFEVEKENNPYDFFKNGIFLQEAMFYSGTGAYDFQYLRWITEKYSFDKEWLTEHRSIELELFPKFYDRLRKVLQNKLDNRKFNHSTPLNEALLELFCLTETEICGNIKGFKSILKSFTSRLGDSLNESFSEIGDFNIFSEKPIIQIPDGRYFIPLPFCVSEAIYESPYYWMLSDKSYRPIASDNRGKIAEEITAKIIRPIFGVSSTYKNVIIKKSRSSRITDIDVLALYNDTAIVFQVKSKKLTSLSKKGNLDSIQNDFKKAVKDAFKQGLVAKDCILNAENYSFEDDHQNSLLLKPIKTCLIVTIVLDHYPAITHQAHIMLSNDFDELPVAISIFDLDIVGRYLNRPESFIDYIARRTKYSKYYKADNEMCFLGFHLERGLKKYDKADMIGLDETWAQSIDRMYYPEIANLKKEVSSSSNKKTGRNELCPCGSGLKYKKCHGKK